MLIVVVLCLCAWAASDATIAPSSVKSVAPAVAGTEAITIPQMLSYQGKLTDTLGQPVPDGNYQLTFRLYTQPTGGSAVWTEAQTILVKSGLFAALLGTLTPITSLPESGACYLSLQVAANPELSPRQRIVSAAYSYLAGRSASADLLQGKDTTALDSRYVNEGQASSVTSNMIVDGTIAAADLNQMGASTDQVLKWTGSAWAPRNDSVGSGGGGGTVTSVGQATGVLCNPNPITTTGTVGFDLPWCDVRFVNEGQADAVTSSMIVNGTIVAADWNQMGAASGQVMKWIGSAWQPRNDSVDTGDNAWVRGTPDSVLYTVHQLGIARGGSTNMLYGNQRQTHTNLGVACTTGTSGQNYPYVTVSGGYDNTAPGDYATVGGGGYNIASGSSAAVGGGYLNTASASSATVGGGHQNTAAGSYATVAGGVYDTSAAQYSFTTNASSVVPSGYDYSAAFNGQRATASGQTRVGALSKASGTFTIDHPLDPSGKILNHYFIEGPEMRNIYDGEAVLDASGRAVVTLPDYFDALNRKPRVQLTGVGTFEVYIAEKVAGNRFVIGGKPGTEVYWQVTGERQDVSAEITRRLMPVEQPKTGVLAGTMLDDDFLRGAMDQLVREGKAQGIDFRTAAGRQRYEKMKQLTEQR
jgi:hypothetical protein